MTRVRIKTLFWIPLLWEEFVAHLRKNGIHGGVMLDTGSRDPTVGLYTIWFLEFEHERDAMMCQLQGLDRTFKRA